MFSGGKGGRGPPLALSPKCFVIILDGILSLECILRNAPAFSRGVFSHPQNASETATEKNPTTAGLIFVLQLLKNEQKITDNNKNIILQENVY